MRLSFLPCREVLTFWLDCANFKLCKGKYHHIFIEKRDTMKLLVLLVTAGIFGIAALSLKALGKGKRDEQETSAGCSGNCAGCQSSCHSEFIKKE